MFATLIVRRAIAATCLVVATNSFATASFADNCQSGTQLLPFGAYGPSTTDTKYSATIPDWNLGDCQLRHGVIHFDHGRGTFDAMVATTFTHNKDYWHFRLRVSRGPTNDPSKQTLLFVRSWDGPPMSERDRPLFHKWHVDFTYSGDLNPPSAEAWSCC